MPVYGRLNRLYANTTLINTPAQRSLNERRADAYTMALFAFVILLTTTSIRLLTAAVTCSSSMQQWHYTVWFVLVTLSLMQNGIRPGALLHLARRQQQATTGIQHRHRTQAAPPRVLGPLRCSDSEADNRRPQTYRQTDGIQYDGSLQGFIQKGSV